MATPLYSFMKPKGTSLYVFPSAARDENLDQNNNNYKIQFSKFVCLNFPIQKLLWSDNVLVLVLPIPTHLIIISKIMGK